MMLAGYKLVGYRERGRDLWISDQQQIFFCMHAKYQYNIHYPIQLKVVFVYDHNVEK